MRNSSQSLLLSCAALANAQTVLIRGATVHTVAEQGVLTNTDVLIRDGKIAAVGTGLRARRRNQRRCQGPRAHAGPVRRTVRDRRRRSERSNRPLPTQPSLLNAPAYEMQWRPEFDVTAAYNARSVLVPVARIEGLTWTVLAPGSVEGGTFVAGQGAAVTLDGRYDAVLNGSRSLFINLGGNANSIRQAAAPVSGCCSTRPSAKRAHRTCRTSTGCCILPGARRWRDIWPADASCSMSHVQPRFVARSLSRNATG